MYSVVHNNVFIALVATSFGYNGHHQVSAIQNLKRLVICGLNLVLHWPDDGRIGRN
jgi:hypothetical protein